MMSSVISGGLMIPRPAYRKNWPKGTESQPHFLLIFPNLNIDDEIIKQDYVSSCARYPRP